MKSPSPRYRVNDSWSLTYEEGLLLLNAGADRIFAIEDVEAAVADELIGQWRTKRFDPGELSREGREIFEQLLTAGIIINQIAEQPVYRIKLQFVGDEDATLTTAIRSQLGVALKMVKEGDCDLLVIIRTNGRLQDILDGSYGEISSPHLLLDLAYEHSVSLGPLVFRGDTACLSCLVGRLTTYWGDALPPKRPAIQATPALIAGLLSLELEKILTAYNRELVNNTVAYDFDDYKVIKSSVYKLPMCPVCSITTMDSPGAITLPWLQKS